MAGKSLFEYWFKTEKRNELLKGKKIYQVAELIGIDKHFLSNVINRNLSIKHKAIAYAVTKYGDSEAEIEYFFERKSIQ